MDCRDMQLLISIRLDGAHTDHEDAMLKEHLAACKACDRELTLQERLSGALRDMGREEIQAPPELCGMVMGKLREGRRKVIPWLPPAWRKAAAAAAAFLLIAGGSVGVNTGLKLAGGGKMIGHLTTSAGPGPGSGGEITVPTNTDAGNSNQGDALKSPVNVNEPADGQVGNGSRDGSSKPAAGDKTPAPNVSGPSDKETLVLLNSSMKVSSTLLKLAVADMAEAKTKAVALAAGAGAAAQVFPEQNDGKRILVMRLTAASDQADGLIAGLAGLGTLIDRQDESRDITYIYNETLIQYRDLQSRINASDDAGEKKRLEVQAATYKQQLDAWEAEAGKRVIMLWLENR